MPPEALPIVRWMILAMAVVTLLLGTALYEKVQAPLVRRLMEISKQSGRPMPAVLVSETFMRGYAVFNAVVMIALWWYLGTAAGAAMWAGLAAR